MLTINDIEINCPVNIYLGEKERLATALRVGIITREQYEETLKYHIKNHLKRWNSSITKRHTTKNARLYNSWLNSRVGRMHDNMWDLGGSRRLFTDSLVTKVREPLRWEDE